MYFLCIATILLLVGLQRDDQFNLPRPTVRTCIFEFFKIAFARFPPSAINPICPTQFSVIFSRLALCVTSIDPFTLCVSPALHFAHFTTNASPHFSHGGGIFVYSLLQYSACFRALLTGRLCAQRAAALRRVALQSREPITDAYHLHHCITSRRTASFLNQQQRAPTPSDTT